MRNIKLFATATALILAGIGGWAAFDHSSACYLSE